MKSFKDFHNTEQKINKTINFEEVSINVLNLLKTLALNYSNYKIYSYYTYYRLYTLYNFRAIHAYDHQQPYTSAFAHSSSLSAYIYALLDIDLTRKALTLCPWLFLFYFFPNIALSTPYNTYFTTAGENSAVLMIIGSYLDIRPAHCHFRCQILEAVCFI